MASSSVRISQSPSTSSSETENSHSDLEILEETDEEEESVKIRVDYKVFFELPEFKPTAKSNCSARCKLCHGDYKYTLTTKGNLLNYLHTAHPKRLHDYKNEQSRLRYVASTSVKLNLHIPQKI